MALANPLPSTVELFTKPPKTQPTKWKPGQLTSEQLEAFFHKGFVIIKDFFDVTEELEPVREDIRESVEQLAQKLFKAGKIKDLYQELDLFKRLTRIDQDFPGANILLHKDGHLPPAFRKLWSNERLLNIMEQLLGTEDIQGHPVWNLRTKTPKNEVTTVPWHQDVAYLDADSYNVMQPTAWIPLIDATKEIGCMEVVSGGHRTARVATHTCCYGDTWYVMLAEEELEKSLCVDVEKDTVLTEVPYGGMLLLNNLIPHRSLSNLSDSIRWSVDFRWQRTNQPVGFYGISQGVTMRSSAGHMDIDWNGFVGQANRHETQELMQKFLPELDIEDTTITGPWMKRWPLVHKNRHTEAYTRTKISYHSKP